MSHERCLALNCIDERSHALGILKDGLQNSIGLSDAIILPYELVHFALEELGSLDVATGHDCCLGELFYRWRIRQSFGDGDLGEVTYR